MAERHGWEIVDIHGWHGTMDFSNENQKTRITCGLCGKEVNMNMSCTWRHGK